MHLGTVLRQICSLGCIRQHPWQHFLLGLVLQRVLFANCDLFVLFNCFLQHTIYISLLCGRREVEWFHFIWLKSVFLLYCYAALWYLTVIIHTHLSNSYTALWLLTIQELKRCIQLQDMPFLQNVLSTMNPQVLASPHETVTMTVNDSTD